MCFKVIFETNNRTAFPVAKYLTKEIFTATVKRKNFAIVKVYHIPIFDSHQPGVCDLLKHLSVHTSFNLRFLYKNNNIFKTYFCSLYLGDCLEKKSPISAYLVLFLTCM